MRRLTILCAAALMALVAQPSFAAVTAVSWDGGNGAWGDSNWGGGGAGPGFTFGGGDPTFHVTIDTGDSVDATANTLVVNNNGADTTQITLDGGSTLTVGALDLNGAAGAGQALLEILDGNLIVNTEMRLDGANGDNAEIQITKGQITLNASHSMKGNNNFFQDDHINFLGAAGDASVLYTSIDSNSARTLAGRVARGFFSIDSTIVDPAAGEADIAALNAELVTLAVNGKYFFVDTSVSGEQTLVLLPEPSSMALLGLGGLLIARRRRA